MFHFDVLRHVYTEITEIQIGFTHVRHRSDRKIGRQHFFVGSEPNGLGSDVRGEYILIEKQTSSYFQVHCRLLMERRWIGRA